MLTVLEEYLHPPESIILRGKPARIDLWQRELGRLYAPRRMIFAIASDASGLPIALADKPARDPAVAYLCQGSTCSEPIEDLGELIARLRVPSQSTDPSQGPGPSQGS
jgi:hypothetical protein